MRAVLLVGPVLTPFVDPVGQAAFCKKSKACFSLIKEENQPINAKEIIEEPPPYFEF